MWPKYELKATVKSFVLEQEGKRLERESSKHLNPLYARDKRNERSKRCHGWRLILSNLVGCMEPWTKTAGRAMCLGRFSCTWKAHRPQQWAVKRGSDGNILGDTYLVWRTHVPSLDTKYSTGSVRRLSRYRHTVFVQLVVGWNTFYYMNFKVQIDIRIELLWAGRMQYWVNKKK